MNGTFARKFTISYRRILTRNVFTVLLVHLITNTFLVITSSRQLQQTLLKMYFLEVLVQSNMRVQTSFLKSIFHASKVRQRDLIFLFTLLLSTCISRLGNLGTDRPSFILAVIGRTGSYKTSTFKLHSIHIIMKILVFVLLKTQLPVL